MHKPHLLFFFLFLLACTSKETPITESVRPVKYQKVSYTGGSYGRTFSGTAIAGVETQLSFRVGGIINKVNVKVGQKISKGMLMASLDPSDYELSYEESDASVKNADAQEKQTKSNFERVAVLYENQNTSLAEYEAAKAQYESAKANEKAMKQRRKQAESQLSYTRLYAPISGIVNNVYVEENEVVATGNNIVTLSSGDNLEVLVGIPESFITDINQGQKVQISFTSLADQQFAGTVSEVSYALSSETAIYPVTIKVDQSNNQVRPGMSADVTFNFQGAQIEEVLMVTPSAVGEDQNGNFVYVLEPSEETSYKVRKTLVTVGNLTVDGFEVQSGLQENDLVATAGLQSLLDGMTVSLFDSAP
ncbi:MAG: efflux RND transporter periplasmic adaptor subunit [Cyclobacteriaceae bacterium]|nr:efflux RND transporter periplasmic adaptor subunit [Cyclobacteriaceae bacterium]